MDTSTALNVNDLFSAKGLVVVVSGGGSGIVLPFSFLPFIFVSYG